ncbi:MAG: Unknown protein [uncultured Sulfurovum sp.]|uniref:Outer membrane protein n=1 Tax=uncultured Sulfurovum sp. TaxID=269237 RepID=A0A6S6U2L7_9BACT|nr:MAG: Unknown protein [uncultured Sulfurovum sp.]
MKKILFVLLILIIPIAFLIFNDKGNEYLKPYVGTYLETKLEQNMSVEVQHLKIDLNYVEIDALLNDLTKIKAQGEVSLFSQTLDMNYTLKSDGFKTFDNQVDINGTLLGSFTNLQVKGEGETLKSYINYALNIKDDVINNIKVNINQADIASLLELTAQKAYADGKIDVNINIPTFKDMSKKGKAKIVLHETNLNEEVFKKEFKVDLPKKTVITANINSKVSAETFELEGDIKSNLASLKLSKTTYNLKSKELLTDYVLTAPKLSKLIFLTKQKLNGKLRVAGKFIFKKDAFNLQGKSTSFDGTTDFNFNGKKLNLKMHKVEIAKLLHLVGEKPYATGKVMAELKLSDIKNLKGTFKVSTAEAKTINQSLKKELNIDFEKAIAFSLKSKGNIASNLVSVQSTLNSDIFNYRSDDMKYQLKDTTLISTYLLEIPKLSKLTTIAGKPLQGDLVINGQMNYHNTLEMRGSSKSLGGNIDFKLAKQQLNTNIKDVSLEKLIYVLDYPQVFKALLVGEFKYDLAKRQGTFTSRLNKAQLLSNQLTVLIKQIRGVDLTKERYNMTHFNAVLDKDIININFKARSKNVLLELPIGRINKATNTIDTNYKINIEDKDIGGKIQGNITKPNITIESSSFIQDKVIDAIKDKIPSETLKDLGLDKMETETIKDTVKNLLGDLFK